MTQTRVAAVSARVYLRSRALLEAAYWSARAIHDGLWLGALNREALHEIDTAYYERQGMYLDEGYNRSGLSDWEQSCVQSHFPAGGRVIVTGAGAGREVLALLNAGYDTWGYEVQSRFVDYGNTLLSNSGHERRLHVMARDVWPPAAESCDAVVVGWGSYMLIADRRARIRFLRGARSALPDGGPLLVSFFHMDRHIDGLSPYLYRVARYANAVRCFVGGSSLLVGDALVPNYAHYFTRGQLEEELSLSGFALAHYGFDDYGHAVAVAASSPVGSSATRRV